jgi:TonB family protein
MKYPVIVAAAVVGITLSGCATIIKGSSQSIAITTPPTTGADCVLSSKEGSWTVNSPGRVTVARSKEDILVHCSKTGFQEAAATIPSNFDGWTLGNLVVGGVIGVGVDAATGAINDYPHAFQVPMMLVSDSSPSSGTLTSALQPGSEATPHMDEAFPHVQPPYPDNAQTNGEQGTVLVDVLVRPSGKAAKIKVAQSSGFEDLDNAAVEGVLNWHFIPAIRDGDPVSEWTTVKIVYQLPTLVPATFPASTSAPAVH